MTFRVELIPALKDNYIFALIDGTSCVIVDPSTAQDVEIFLEKNSVKLEEIWLTHHHHDHVGGVNGLIKSFRPIVRGFEGDAARLPPLTHKLSDGQTFRWQNRNIFVQFIPGHTLGHICYFLTEDKILFVGDTLFSLGCGRLFEGTPEQMWSSLKKIGNLPDSTKVYCAHEYTDANFRFVKTLNSSLENEIRVELDQRKNHAGQTVPSTLSFEKKFNPFLLCKDAKEFAALRKMKDDF